MHTINKLKIHSCGFGNITNKFVEHIKYLLLPVLTLIINQMLTKWIFPESLKIAKIKPLYKKMADASNFNNYRPISLLPVISKYLKNSSLSNIESGVRKAIWFSTKTSDRTYSFKIVRLSITSAMKY